MMESIEQKQQNLKKQIQILFTTDKLPNILTKLSQIARIFIRENAEGRYVKCLRNEFIKNKQTKSKKLLRIIYLIDKLIKEHQNYYRQHISPVICQIFVQLFSIFFQTNSRSQIQQMKMMRKAWPTFLPDDVLQSIRRQILRIFSFNIDSGFSKKKLIQLKEYYTEKLKLSPEDCLKYLPDDWKRLHQETEEQQDYTAYQAPPEKKTKSPIIYQPEKPRTQPILNPMNNISQHTIQHNPQINTPIMHPYNSYFPPPMQIQNINTKPSNTTYVFGYTHPTNNYQHHMASAYQNYYPPPIMDPTQMNYYQPFPQNHQQMYENPIEINKYPKNNYDQSRNVRNMHPTNTQNTSINLPINIPNVINVIPTKNQPTGYHSNALQKYKELKQLGKYKCPRCGLQTSNRDNYDMHLKSHYQQAKKGYQISKKNLLSIRVPLMNLQNWISLKQKQDDQEYFIQLDKITNNYCKFCCNRFQPQWDLKLEKWIYKNVILVQINKKAKTNMHYSCFNCLEQENKNDVDSIVY